MHMMDAESMVEVEPAAETQNVLKPKVESSGALVQKQKTATLMSNVRDTNNDIDKVDNILCSCFYLKYCIKQGTL